ncbi:MAG: N-acetyltransferase family protein [Solirubrobacterales bacterium]
MRPEETVVRATAQDDLDAVAEIFSHYVINTLITFEETPPTVAQWQQRLDDLTKQELPFLVAEAREEVVGYAYACPWRSKPAYCHTLENTVYLRPDWIGQRIGSALLGALLPWCAKANGRQVIAVIADTGDSASTALHRAFGFTDVGRLTGVGYKHGRWIDTLLMQRDLTTDLI